MHFTTSTLLITLLSASTTIAMPRPQTTIPPTQASASFWQIANYAEGCSPGGCTYNFDISSSDPNPDFGGVFSTHCTGTRSTESPSTNCTDNTQLSSSSVVQEGVGAVLFVERLFPLGDETDVAGGNVTTAGPGEPAAETFLLRARVFGQLAGQ